MKRFQLSFFALLSMLSSTFSQTGVFSATSVQIQEVPVLEAQFTSYSVVSLQVPDLNQYIKNTRGNIDLELHLGAFDAPAWQLSPHDLRSENYQLIVSTEAGMEYLNRAENTTYRGVSKDKPTDFVRLSIDTESAYFMWQQNGELFFLEPLWRIDPQQPHDYYILYSKSQLKPIPAGACGWSEDLHARFNRPLARIPSMAPGTLEKAGNCYTAQIALAADWSMVQVFGSASSVITFMTGVLNNVQTNYDNEFADQITFEITGTFISSCSSCNPWTSSTDAENLLDDFTVWGESGGFGGISYDLASLWTNREFLGDVIGVAWLGGLCSELRYNVLQNFTLNSDFLRVLQAHEIGHLFNSDHDAPSSPTIMAPVVSASTQWSSTSVAVMNAYISSNASPNGCLSGCQAQAPPVAAIFAPVTHICPGSSIPFIDNSTGSPSEWDWFFPGGSPSSSTQQNPSVKYDSPGSYPVTLIVSNNAGTDATALTQNIEVDNDGLKFLLYETFEAGPAFWQIYNPNSGSITWEWVSVGGTQYGKRAMSINNFNYSSLNHVDGLISPPLDLTNESNVNLLIDYAYRRYNAANSDRMRIVVSTNGGQTFPFTIFDQTENGSGNLATAADSQLPFNPSAINDWCYGTDFGADCLSISLDDFIGQSNVRIRIDNITDHGNNLYVDNIRVTADCQTILPPVAAFSATPTVGCAPLTVQYQDQSSGIIFSRQWNFPGGSPAVSSEINPTVVYSQAGTYSATLQVNNSSGSDIAVQGDYIIVLGSPQVNFQSAIQGNVATFTNQSTNASNYLWNFGDGATSTAANPVHTYLQAGTYTVKLTASNECGSKFIQKTITITNPLIAGFSVDQQGNCAPSSVSFADASTGGAISWNWVFEGGQPDTSSLANPVVVFNDPGAHLITLTVGNGFAQNTITDTVFVEGPPLALFTADTTLGQTSVIFNSNSVQADSLFWDFGDGGSSTDDNPEHSYAADGNYSVTLIAVNNCGSDTSQQNIGILTPPQAAFSSNATAACAPQEVLFSASPQGAGLSYLWAFEGGQPSSSIEANPIVTYSQSGTYDVFLIISNAAGSDTISQNNYVEILPGPIAGFNYNYTLGQSVVDFFSTSTSNSLLWDFGDGEIETSNTPSHQYEADGDYIVTLIASNDCGSDTTQQNISILTPPQAIMTSSAVSGCAPLTIQYDIQPQRPDWIYSWTFEGGMPSTSSLANPSVTYTQAGSYGLILVISNAAGSDTIIQDAYITAFGAPTAGFGYVNIPGSPDVNFGNTSSGAESWLWQFGDGASSSENAPTHRYEAEGNYQVTLIAFNECGSDTTEQLITILLPPQANFTSSASSGCAPLEVSFEASTQGAGYTYAWTFEGGQPASSTAPNPVVSFSQAGLYDVTLVLSNAIGADMLIQTDYVSLNGPPTAAFSSTVNGPSASFTNNSIEAISYHWDFGDGQSSEQANPQHQYTAEGVFLVTLTATNACGSTSYSAPVTISEELPIGDFTTNIQAGCGPLTVQFMSTATNADSISWSFPGGTPAVSSSLNPLVTFATPGTYNVTLVAFNIAGSASITRLNWIEVFPNPTAGFSFTQNETTITFSNTSTESQTYTWLFGDGQTSNEENPAHIYPGAGIFEATLIAQGDCGTDTTTQQIEIIGSAPGASFTASTQAACAPALIQFTDQSSGSPTSWIWEFPGGEPNTSTNQHPQIAYNLPGSYSASLTVSNPFGTENLSLPDFLIINSIPQAAFTYQISLLEVSFSAESTAANTQWQWDFGDGFMGQGQQIQHTYTAPGTYEVKLISTNECGQNSSTQVIQIIVDAIEEAAKQTGKLIIFPNPNQGQFTLTLSNFVETNALLLFSNAIGQTLSRQEISLNNGSFEQSFEYNDWAPGVYWCTIQLDKSARRIAFIIQ